MKLDELLPCPFCGGGVFIDDDTMGHSVVCCSNLDCRSQGPFRPDDERAIAAWNHRTGQLVPREAVEGAVVMTKRLDEIASALLNMIAAIEDEGDRTYFGSTNDADTLREIAHELDAERFASLKENERA